MSESLWVELSHTKVGVTQVHPGPVRTSLMATSRTTDQALTDRMVDLLSKYAPKPEGVANKIVRAIRWRRRRLRIGITTALTHWTVRFWPGLLQSLLGFFFRRRARKK